MIQRKNDQDRFTAERVLRTPARPKTYRAIVRLLADPIRVPEKPSTFHPLAQQNVFRHRNVRQQSRLFCPLKSTAET